MSSVSLNSANPGNSTAARLEIVSGPLAGQIFEFTGSSLTIGREPSNNISIRDGSVSRNHCRIELCGADYRILDQDSRNGTFVNATPVKDHLLQHGDSIKIGSTVILFRCAAADQTAPFAPVALESGPPLSDATMILRSEDALYLRPQAEAHLPTSDRTVRDLDVLLSFSRTVSSLRKLDELQRQVLETALAISPAGRAALLLREEGATGFSSTLGWDRNKGAVTFAVSRTIADRVLQEGVSVLSNDVAGDDDLNTADSLVNHKVRAVAAVPLSLYNRVIGLLYLDGTEARAGFDAALIQLLTAVGNVAALAIENARHFEWLEGENRRLRDELEVQHNMVGESAAMRDVLQFIGRAAPSGATVLIAGESGTGKELVARAIHRNSPRAEKPFVAINCGAIAENLLESELFGHEKGAFTGAAAQKKGKLEIANGGTVFLDEIGELAPQLQVKLLRVLQEREFERVGGTRTYKLDIRLIAATNRDLKAGTRNGQFREDLYYRLNVLSVRMPALRDRRDDIQLLASYFASRAAEKTGRSITGISPRARACLLRYDWPGNVRELENAIERAVVLGASDFILPEDLPDAIVDQAASEDQPVSPLHEAMLDFKRQLILGAIDRASGNYTEAAKALGVHPNHFFRLIRTLNMKPKRQKD